MSERRKHACMQAGTFCRKNPTLTDNEQSLLPAPALAAHVVDEMVQVRCSQTKRHSKKVARETARKMSQVWAQRCAGGNKKKEARTGSKK